MKKCYFIFVLLFTMAAYGQNKTQNDNTSLQESSFRLYPNPATSDLVYITTEANSTKEIIIYDIFGEVVLTDRIKSKALNISRLVAGVYVLQVNENNETITRKLVVK